MSFPVTIDSKVNIKGNEVSLFQLLREGRANKVSSGKITTLNSGTVNFGASLTGGCVWTSRVGRAALIMSVTASSTGLAQCYCLSTVISKVFTSAQLGQAGTSLDAAFGPNGGSITINPLALIGSEGSFDINFISLNVDASVKPYCSSSIYGIDFTADYNFSAKRAVMVIGESTSWQGMDNDASGVAYAGEKLWPFQVVNAMKQQGKSVRLINKAYGGMSSSSMEYARRSQYYDVDCDLYFVNLGQNDVTATTTQTAYKSNLANIITHRNTFNRAAPVVFISCFPTDVSGIANYRTWMQDVANDASVGGGTTNNVWFIDGSTAFALNGTATADTNFSVSNRVANARIHYSGEGMTLNATAVMSAIQAMSWYNSF